MKKRPNADVGTAETLTGKQAYLRTYYADHKREIRAKQKASYEAKYAYVSPELLEHLRANRTHALGGITCPDCERLGPVKAVVCLECGRASLTQLAFHARKQHALPIEPYKEKWGYNAAVSLTSAGFHEARSRLSSSAGNVRRLKSLAFDSARARRVNKGRRYTLRRQAIDARHLRARRASQTEGGRRTKLALRKLPLPDWSIAERRLAGAESKQIAAELHVSRAFVNDRCRKLGLGSKAVLFWRGEPISSRHLDSLLRESGMSTSALASKLGVPVHRLSRALRRRGKPLPLDLAEMVRKELEEIKPSGPRALRPAERQEITWKSRALRGDLKALRDALMEKPSNLAATICDLHRQGQVAILFWWAREFVSWVADQYGQELELSRVADIANEFLASEYPVSADTLPHLVQPAIRERATADKRCRCAIADVLTAFGAEPWMWSSELLRRLQSFGLSPWTKMHSEKQLANVLRPLGAGPRNRRSGTRVFKGYRRADLKAWQSKEAARRLGVSLATLNLYIRNKTIPVPPLVRRRGVRGKGHIRVWTESDIMAARAALANRAPKTLARSRNPFPSRPTLKFA